MGDGFQYLDIVVFAVIAGFLVLRLRNTLGRRTGQERQRDIFMPRGLGAPTDEAKPLPPPGDIASAPAGSGLARLKAVDPRFDEQAFLKGARGAFEIIVNAFAKGDTASLRPLLSDSVYASFSAAIRQRLERRQTLETTLLTIKTIEIADGELEGDVAFITVRFVSDQINVTRAADRSVVEGDPDRVVEKTDLWTFSRSLRSRDPNWVLVATNSP
jgi:predicted lipid-binding transport protein (Tim44 family)